MPTSFGGIPQDIGKEFVGDAKGHAAGTLFVAKDGEVLMLRRSSTEGNYKGHWSLPGGKAEDGETPELAADREAREEMGDAVPAGEKKVLDRRQTPNGMVFHTYVQPVADKFVPKLDSEHSGYAWASLDMLPGPMHPGVRATLDERLGIVPDMTGDDWSGLRDGFVNWVHGTPDHAQDAVLAFDRMPPVMTGAPARDGIAFDEASVRDLDREGRLHIAVTNISKAGINPYLGREIPNWRALGLEPERIYQLLRDPEELARAAPTFNNIQVLAEHVPVNVDDHQPDLVEGSTGTDAEFVAPYLRNSLVIWTKGGIEGVKSGAKKELSSAYRYRADMTPGVYMGVPYDGVMRDIIANHVALVKEGRAGSDVVVGDSKEGLSMSKAQPQVLSRQAVAVLGALIPFLKPRLALDAKPNFYPVLAPITGKNFKAQKPTIATALRAAITKDMMAKDASLDDVEKVLDMLDGHDIQEGADADPATGLPMASPLPVKDPAAMDDDPVAKIKAWLKGKLSDEQLAELEAMTAAGATDEPPPFKDMPKVGGAKDAEPDKDKDKEKDKDMVDKPAMDAAIKVAVDAATSAAIKTQKEIRDAERAVRPYVGELAMSFDSAETVLRAALKTMGVKGHDTIHASALQAVLEMQPLPNVRRPRDVALAQDAASAKSFTDRFPGTQNIRVL